VYEAARLLGLSVDAVRKRVQRGTIAYEKDPAGRVTVLLDTSETVRDEVQDDTGHSLDNLLAAKEETIEELRERVRRLEQDLDIRNEEMRRRDHLLAAALERIPAIEAPQEGAGGAEGGDSDEGPPYGTSRQEAEKSLHTHEQRSERSWWRRFFGVE